MSLMKVTGGSLVTWLNSITQTIPTVPVMVIAFIVLCGPELRQWVWTISDVRWLWRRQDSTDEG